MKQEGGQDHEEETALGAIFEDRDREGPLMTEHWGHRFFAELVGVGLGRNDGGTRAGRKNEIIIEKILTMH